MECEHFILDFFSCTCGFSSVHKRAKTVANLHVILRGGEIYQEHLTVISIQATCSFSRQTLSKRKISEIDEITGNIYANAPGWLQACLEKIPVATKCPDQVFRYVSQTPGLC